MKNDPRIVTCLLAAVALFGVAGVGRCLAEEPGPAAHDAGNVSNLPAEPSGSQPASAGTAGEGTAKVDSQSQTHGKGGSEGTQQGLGAATNSPAAAGPGDNGDHAIDTSIGIPSRRLDRGRSRIENVKARIRLLMPRRPSTPGTLEPGMRNAIGVPVAPHSGPGRREDEHRGVPTVAPNSPASGVATNTKAEDHLERPAFVRGDTGLSAGANTSNRGAISGTGAMHPGASPHGIGGPAKTVAGISGTTIHAKH
jgi:hypothetical protein